MKTLMMIVALAAATPALAGTENFTGPRVALTVGIDDVTGARDLTNVVYGAEAGVDVPLVKNVLVGLEATADNVFERNRTIGVAARVGYAVTPNVLVYGKAGYANYNQVTFNNRRVNLEGLRVGGGVEYAFNSKVFAKAEYRYTDFNGNVGNHGSLVGFGIRF